MSDDNVVQGDFTETVEPPSDEQIQDFIDRGGEAPTYHPVLRVWREVLKPAREEAMQKVTPQWANRIVTSYRDIGFGDMEAYRDRYFAKILELADILDEEIATDEDCLTYTTPEEDVEHNSGHYKRLLTDWQKAILGWELAWDTTDPYAGVELAAISEVHKMYFGETGITAFLDNIKFEFTDADSAALRDELEELKVGTSE